jgi:hypothetical protein
MSDLKGGVRVVDGIASHGEARVLNGALLVRLVPRGTPRLGVGETKVKGGIAEHLEALVIDGRLKVRIV